MQVKQILNCHVSLDGETESKSEDIEQVRSHMIEFFHIAGDEKRKHWRVTSRVLLHGNSFSTVLLTIRYPVSGNLLLSGEPLAKGYFVAPSKEKKINKVRLKFLVKLIKTTT